MQIRRKPEWASPSTPVRPARNIRFNEQPLCPFPTPFLPPLFNSESIELLTGSGEVLVYHIQQWRHHFQSARAEIISQKITATMLKVHVRGPLCLCKPFIFMGLFTCMVIVWGLRGNIIRTAPCGVVWHNVHSQQHTYVSSSYRSSRLGLSHWDPYAMHRGSLPRVVLL